MASFSASNGLLLHILIVMVLVLAIIGSSLALKCSICNKAGPDCSTPEEQECPSDMGPDPVCFGVALVDRSDPSIPTKYPLRLKDCAPENATSIIFGGREYCEDISGSKVLEQMPTFLAIHNFSQVQGQSLEDSYDIKPSVYYKVCACSKEDLCDPLSKPRIATDPTAPPHSSTASQQHEFMNVLSAIVLAFLYLI